MRKKSRKYCYVLAVLHKALDRPRPYDGPFGWIATLGAERLDLIAGFASPEAVLFLVKRAIKDGAVLADCLEG